MYKVRYYIAGEKLISKLFNTLHEATMFSVYKINTGNVYAIDKVDDKVETMTNPFRDQEKFMKACDQTTDNWNVEQFNLYVNLIDEEFNDELKTAIKNCDQVEILDALVDILVVTIGAAHSMGADVEGAWKEVMRTNFAKIGEDGKVRKREDGKVLKPLGWTPPELGQFVK